MNQTKDIIDLLHVLATLVLAAMVILQAFKIQRLESKLREKEAEENPSSE